MSRNGIPRLLAVLFSMTAIVTKADQYGDFTYSTDGTNVTITYYTGPGGVVVIPSTISNLPVTVIGPYAFPGGNNFSSISIPNSVVRIEDSAFACGTLHQITIPDSVTYIGRCAFYSSALTNVNLGHGVANIGEGAFYICNQLTNVLIPSSVTNIGIRAFAWDNMTAINVESSNIAYCSVDGVLFDRNTNALVQYPTHRSGNYTTPETATDIGSYAFTRCDRLTNVILSDSIQTIESNAFEYCTVKNVSIGNGVTSIGTNAFLYCTGLGSVTIPNNNTHIGDFAFSYCTGLTNVVISDGVINGTTIGNYAFNRCSALVNVAIGNGVINVGNYAFNYCTGLINVMIPNSVINVGNYAFEHCGSLTNVVIPSSVTNIGDYAFDGCMGLTNATIGNSVVGIGTFAFYGCRNLTRLTIPNCVTRIGMWAFYGCKSLTNVTIGSGVTDIGSLAFYYCPNLTNVYFKGNVLIADSSVFDLDNNVTVYYLPGTLGWNPQVQLSSASFGVWTNWFGFSITGTSGLGVVVEACTNLAIGIWIPVSTNTITNGLSYFSDAQWTNYPSRFYRLRGLRFAGRPAVLWNPTIQSFDGGFGVGANGFGFNITGTTNIPIVLETAANLTGPWTVAQSCTLTNGSVYFGDPDWTNYPSRFYRIRSP